MAAYLIKPKTCGTSISPIKGENKGRVQEVRECVGSPNNRGTRWPKPSTIDVIAKRIH